MRSIDMSIHLVDGTTVLYERISAKDDLELQEEVINKSVEWGTKGVWSDWEKGRGTRKVFYTAASILKIKTCGEEAFGLVEGDY